MALRGAFRFPGQWAFALGALAMLRELRIQNIAIIQDLTLFPGPGMNVLTGETGAGKSIIVDALELALGAPAATAVIRDGASQGVVEAHFSLGAGTSRALLERLADEGLRDEEAPGSLVLTRILRASRSSARINGLQVALPILRELAAMLVDIHGQSEHLSLLRPGQHLFLLDRYASLEAERAEFAREVGTLRSLQAEADEKERVWRRAQQQRDRWQEDLVELEAAALREGEESELRVERERLSNREQLIAQTATALALLAGEDRADAPPAAADAFSLVAAALARVAQLDGSGQEMAQKAEELQEETSGLLASLWRYRESLEFEPQRLHEIEERLEIIRRCLRRFGGSVAAAMAHEEQARAATLLADDGKEEWEQLRATIELRLRQVGEKAASLSQKRRGAAETLSAAIEAELAHLGMPAARFAVRMAQEESETGCPLPDGRTCRFGAQGVDRVTFTLSANPGEAPQPLAQVASGGETARIMLALKGVLAAADPIPTLIFDEIDQGIGGRLGARVGERLRQLAGSGHQVLVVTHLAQLAAFADAHFVAQKTIAAERTVTHAEELATEEGRIEELAAMLGAATATGRLNAAELLERARSD